jgi:CBS domain-containing membrane protein
MERRTFTSERFTAMREMSRKFINFKKEKDYNKKPYKVGEVFDKNIKPLFYDELLLKAKATIKSKGLRGIAVTNHDYTLMGCITRVKILQIAPNCSTMLVKDVIEDIKIEAFSEDYLKNVVEEMLKNNADCIPVLDEKNEMKFKGMLTLDNVLDVLSKTNNEMLYEKIKDKINIKPIFCKNIDTLSYAWKKMNANKLTGIIVLDEEERLVGVLTHHDILSVKIPHIHLTLDDPNSSIQVNSIMTSKNIIKVTKNHLVIDAIKIMLKHKIGRLPVMDDDNNKTLGMIDKQALIQPFINLL